MQELLDLIKYAYAKGFKVSFVGKKVLHDYWGMNPEAANIMDFRNIKDKEIEVEKNLSLLNQKETLQHEIIERNLIFAGMAYFPAHLIALKLENVLLTPKQLDVLARIGKYEVKQIHTGNLTLTENRKNIVLKTDGSIKNLKGESKMTMPFSDATNAIVGMTPTIVAANTIEGLTSHPRTRVVIVRQKAKSPPKLSKAQKKRSAKSYAGERGISEKEAHHELFEKPEIEKRENKMSNGIHKRIDSILKQGANQAAFANKENANEFAEKLAKKGYKINIFPSSGPVVDKAPKGYKGTPLYVMGTKTTNRVSLKSRSNVKLVKMHDDGDMTVKQGGRLHVVTTDHKVFRELPRKQAVKTGLTSIRAGQIYKTHVPGGTVMSRRSLGRRRR
jgi:hypothetical protein